MSQYLLPQSILANKTRQHTIKEEVASVLLSAMMGYIIERWESEPIQLPPEKKIVSSIDLELSAEDINTVSITESKPSSVRKQSSSISQNRRKKKSKSSMGSRGISSTSSRTSRQKTNIPTENLPSIVEKSSKEGLHSQSLEGTDLQETLGEESYPLLSLSSQSQSSSKQSGSQDFLNKFLSDWRFLERDESVVIHFKQGNKYKGPLSRCRMHGKGEFFWTDGSTYEGDFDEGEITGNGILKWPDQSWYEGSFYKGYRHGYGLLVLNNYFCYIGNWYLGQKHGLGYLNYKDPQKQHDYYNGEWNLGCREGTGLRHYISGARYSGEWLNNYRHGLGTMVWTNNDVYSGNWSNGEIEGYGEYTWNTFFNKQFVIPQENCYYGSWKKGIRDGNGILELASGATIRGSWSNGLKHGSAEVVCANGTFVHVHDLFIKDCVSQIPNESTTEQPTTSMYHVPVNSACHDIDMTVYTERLTKYRTYCAEMRINNEIFEKFKFCNETQKKQSISELESNHSNSTENYKSNEEKWLQNIILCNLHTLKGIYKMYAEIGCSNTVYFESVMTRILLWQLWRDCGFHKRLPLADIDIIIASNASTLMESVHYPFERIQFWQFLHCLIELSWQFYILNYKGYISKVPAVLASALDTLINNDILPNMGVHEGNALFRYRDLLSTDAMYWLYRGLGETLSARQFIKFIMISDSSSQTPIPLYPSYALQGTNAFSIGGKLMYLQGEEPLCSQEKLIARENELLYTQPMSSLQDIGKKRAVKNLLKICPTIKEEGLYINIDYQLVFLEFYELLLLCGISSVKKALWIEKKREQEEEERLKRIEEEKLKLLEDEIKLKKPKSADKKKTAKSHKKATA